jgi:hypothetical protein
MISKEGKKKIIQLVEMGIDNLIEKQPNTHLNLFNSGIIVDLKGVEKKVAKRLLKTIENISQKHLKKG